MQGVTPDQQLSLNMVAQSIQATNYGQQWPTEYKEFTHVWGYFNAVYNTLYTDTAEWKRIAQFAIDPRFTAIWSNLRRLKSIRELAKQPCVGDGRDSFKPSDNVQIAFNTLRSQFGFSVRTPCRRKKCTKRRQSGWNTCLQRTWPAPQTEATRPEYAKYTPLGAVLTIIYQIRNNLFHGAKTEIFGEEYERNRLLVLFSLDTVKALLAEVVKLI